MGVIFFKCYGLHLSDYYQRLLNGNLGKEKKIVQLDSYKTGLSQEAGTLS